MYVYLLGTLLSIIICLIIYKNWGFESKKTKKMFISLLPLTIISAIRYDVGWDYLNIYTRGFYMNGKYNLNYFDEILFNKLLKILYNLFGDPISMFLLMSIIVALVFSVCYKLYGYSNKPWIYIILFVMTRYYFCSMNIMRQATAALIILASFKSIKDKNIWKYTILVLTASSFHIFSLIFLPLYFILNKDIIYKKNLLLIIVSIPILLLGFFLTIKISKYEGYFNTMFGNDGGILWSELLICLAIMIPSISSYKKLSKENDMFTIFENLEFISLIIIIFSFALPTPDRLLWYFNAQNIFLIPIILNHYKKRDAKLFFKSLIFGSLIIVFFMQNVMGDSYSVLPYQTIFNIENRWEI